MSSVLDDHSQTTGRASGLLTPPKVARRPRVRAPAVPSRHLRDPVLVGLVSFVVYALHGYDGGLDRDLGVFTYGGEHVAHGIPPYVGIFNSVGPLADAVPGLAIWLGNLIGADPILSARLFFTVLSAVACALLFVLGRDTFGSRAAGYLAVAVFLTFPCFLRLASGGPREKTTMVVFLLACLVLLGRRRWEWAGVFAGLATLTWQPAFAVAVAAVVTAALLDQHDRTRRILLRFTVGGLVPSLATVAFFLSAGALTRAMDGFVLINARYTTQPSVLDHPVGTAGKLWAVYHETLLLVPAGLAALILLGARAVPWARRRTVSPVARRLVVVAAGAAAGSAWSLTALNGAPDLFVVLPFAALGVAGTAVLLLSRLPRRTALVTVVTVVSLTIVAAGVESVATRDDRLLRQRADVEAVLGTQPADATVATIDAPEVLAIAGRDDVAPYQLFDKNMERYLNETYPGGMHGFLRYLRAKRPTFVAVGSTFRGHWPYHWLTRDYVRIGGGTTWCWYIRASVGPAAVLRARVAHERAVAAYGW